MARKKKKGCLGMILGIGMSVAVVVVLGDGWNIWIKMEKKL